MTKPKDPSKLEAYYERERARKRKTPSFLGTPDLPPDHRLKGVSVLTDASGNLAQRWDKTERDSTPEGELPATPPDFAISKQSRFTDAQGKVRGMWTGYSKPLATQWEQMQTAVKAFADGFEGRHQPEPMSLQKTVRDPALLNVFPLGDPHIGMLAWAPESGSNFDLKLASEGLRRVVNALVQRAPFASEAMLVNVGDFFHADDDTQLTPASGHKLDVEGRASKVFQVGCELMVWMVTELLRKHETVGVWNAPGNHDPLVSRFLGAWLQAWFRNEPRVKIHPNLNPFQYYRFGKNLFGITHGDGCQLSALPEIMACDAREDWGQTTHHEWLTGHVHHDQIKDFRDCVVGTYRTLAARDYWHNSKGYRAKRSLQVKTYHKELGPTGQAVEFLPEVLC